MAENWKKKQPKTKQKKNVIFHLSKAITLTRSCLTTFIPKDFCRSYSKDHFSNKKNLAGPNGFGDICEKLLSVSDPYVLLLVIAAMFYNGYKIPMSVLCRIS